MYLYAGLTFRRIAAIHILNSFKSLIYLQDATFIFHSSSRYLLFSHKTLQQTWEFFFYGRRRAFNFWITTIQGHL